MKKLLGMLLALALCVSTLTFTACSGNRDEILKIYNWGEYMDESLYDEFAVWYADQTGGKKIKVVPDEFITNEEMLTRVEKDRADYDLICPSDYYVERMIEKGLVKKVDKSVIDVEQVIKPEYLAIARTSDPTLEYAVPFMYGTFGLMYDYSKTGEHIDSWDAIFTDAYNKKCTTKKSLREAYASASIWNARQELGTLSENFTVYGEAYQAKLQSIYEDVSDSAIAAAKATLTQQKNYTVKWDEEDVKFDMAGGSSDIEVALMWSCDAGYVMNDYEGADGNQYSGNRNLWYHIPKEGGNVYIDSFVISEHAGNVEAANLFLKFLCLKETAVANSNYIGAISPVAEAYDALYEEYTTDTSYAEESGPAWRDMYIDMLFPSEETLKRCGVMKDYGDAEAKVMQMWANVSEG